MKNSVRTFRNAKGLTLREFGDRVGYAFQTIATYENYDRPLPSEFLRKASGVLGVSEDALSQPPPSQADKLQEDSPPYRVTSIALNHLPVPLLQAMMKVFGERIALEDEPARSEIMHSLFSITNELKRRGAPLAKAPAPPSASSAQVYEDAQSVKFLADHMPDESGHGDTGESEQKRATDAPSSRKKPPSGSSGHQTKD